MLNFTTLVKFLRAEIILAKILCPLASKNVIDRLIIINFGQNRSIPNHFMRGYYDVQKCPNYKMSSTQNVRHPPLQPKCLGHICSFFCEIPLRGIL